MSDDRRQDAVDRVTRLLEQDLVTVDEYGPLVERILATSTELELARIVDDLPERAHDDDVLVIECRAGVVKEVPSHLPATTEIRLFKGVLKVDLSDVDLDGDVDLEINADTGVLKVLVPPGLCVEVVENVSNGGVFKNVVRATADAGGPRLLVHVHNDGAVIKLQRRSRWFRRRR